MDKDIGMDIDVDMDVNPDMAVSITWWSFNGGWVCFEGGRFTADLFKNYVDMAVVLNSKAILTLPACMLVQIML